MRNGFDLCRDAMVVEGITAPEQSVLTTLAIAADADCQCFPGIAWIVARTKLSERTVQRSLQGLKDAGHLSWVERPGRGRVYTIHPRHSGTPAEETPASVAPRQPDGCQSGTPATVTPTPATVAPKQPRTTNISSSPGASAKPDEVTDATWADFTALRRQQRAPPSPTALAGIAREAAKAGWSMEAALAECCARGWRSFKAEWVAEDRNGHRNGMAGHRGGGPSASGGGRTIDAVQLALQRACPPH